MKHLSALEAVEVSECDTMKEIVASSGKQRTKYLS